MTFLLSETLLQTSINCLELAISTHHILAQQENYFRRLVENANDVIFTVTLDGQFTYISPQFQEMLGFTPVEFIGKPFQSLAHPDDVPMMMQVLQRQLVTHEKLSGAEFRLRHQNGEYLWVMANNAAPIADAKGNLVGFQGIVRNIHDRKLADEQIQRSHEQLRISNAELARITRLKDEFLANMSHELRTPLNAILGVSEALLEGAYGPLSPQHHKSLTLVDASGHHLLDLINDILDVAKIESGQLELKPTRISIKYLCEASLSLVRPLAMQQQVELTCEINTDCPFIYVDDRRMRQVLINLLNNAIKFTPSGGTITLVVNQHPLSKTLEFHVQDTGIGIAPENLSQLFQPFMQIDSSLSREYAGTGLGLALVKRIMDLHGGTVSVNSQLGQGSCFTASLPIGTHQPEISPSPQSQSPHYLRHPEPLLTKNPLPHHPEMPLILLAEDNIMNVEIMQDYLHMHGYQVQIAENGLVAIELAPQLQPNLILMDIQMPKMDGLEAMQRLRANPLTQAIPIVALTALTMPGDADKCLRAGANAYLSKPVRLKDLLSQVQQLLAVEPATQLSLKASC
jgi:PAS domain S-box-containing protein